MVTNVMLERLGLGKKVVGWGGGGQGQSFCIACVRVCLFSARIE